MRPVGLVSSALVLLSVAPTGLGPAAPVTSDPRTGILVAVSEVAADRATLWVRADDAAPVRVRYGPDAADAPVAERQAVPAADRDFTIAFGLGDLQPGTRYAYEVTQGGATVRGSLPTAPAPTADAAVRLLWSADLGGGGRCRDVEDGYRIFAPMTARRADFFLFVGDTIYADHLCGPRPHAAGSDFVARSVAEFYAKHRYNRADAAFQRFLRGTPVYATWDDHEVRNNFAGPHEPFMAAGRQAFVDYWGIAGPRAEPQRLYRRVRWGRHVEVFILDTRQYRSSNWTADGPWKTMLGEAQRAWLLDGLAESSATWKLIVSSVPLGMFTGGGAADAWSNANLFGFPRHTGTGFVWERDLILRELRARGVRNVIFVAGEAHHGELIRYEPFPDWVFHEFVAGPLAARQSFPHPLDRSLGPRSLGSLGWADNFGEIVADGATLHARIYDVAGVVRASVRLSAGASR